MTRLVDIMCLKKSLHMGRADLVPKSLNRQHITAPNFVRYFHHLQFIRNPYPVFKVRHPEFCGICLHAEAVERHKYQTLWPLTMMLNAIRIFQHIF